MAAHVDGYGGAAMEGYDTESYGEGIADVYDDWYGTITDVGSTVDALAGLAVPDLPTVELGVGTGRLAIPLAARLGATVYGIDSSAAMLALCAAKDPQATVVAVHGDMIEDLPAGPLGLVFVAFNTFFALGTAALQARCFQQVAQRLASAGCFVIEAFVPDEPARAGDHIDVRTLTTDRVVLSVNRYGTDQVVEGQFIEFSERGGVRLRPWSIRYSSPTELDTMAGAAGLTLQSRWETFAGEPFTDDSTRHVSVYTRPP